MKSELAKIIDEKGRYWGRCKDCGKKHGKKSYDLGYYTYLQADAVFGGLEDPNKIVGYDLSDC